MKLGDPAAVEDGDWGDGAADLADEEPGYDLLIDAEIDSMLEIPDRQVIMSYSIEDGPCIGTGQGHP